MSKYSDAALLKGDYATMLKKPPEDTEWKKAACDNGPEEAAQAIAKQIFGIQKSIDPEKEKLEVITYSAVGPFKVVGILPADGELMRIDGINPNNGTPVSLVQHVEQVSLTFTKVPVKKDGDDDEDGLKIGFVIFDELKERKKVRDAAKRKKRTSRKPRSQK